MTDKEITNALECCCTTKGGGCKQCPLNDYGKPDCQLVMATEAYKLINRQQAEIERLEHLTNTQNIMIDELNKACKNIKANSIKDFAERLKNKSELLAPSVYAELFRAVSVKDIDTLVKELTESEDEENE